MKNTIVSYVRKQIYNGNLLYASKAKAPIWFTTKGLQLPNVVQTIIDASDDSIPKKSKNVKKKFSYEDIVTDLPVIKNERKISSWIRSYSGLHA